MEEGDFAERRPSRQRELPPELPPSDGSAGRTGVLSSDVRWNGATAEATLLLRGGSAVMADRGTAKRCGRSFQNVDQTSRRNASATQQKPPVVPHSN